MLKFVTLIHMAFLLIRNNPNNSRWKRRINNNTRAVQGQMASLLPDIESDDITRNAPR